MNIKLNSDVTMGQIKKWVDEGWFFEMRGSDGFIISDDKIIDLSMMVGSNIDMEFRHDCGIWTVSILSKIEENFFIGKTAETSEQCRVRQDHWHSWQGGECPLPEGLNVMVNHRLQPHILNAYCNTRAGTDLQWVHTGGAADIMSFKVLGPAEGYCYKS